MPPLMPHDSRKRCQTDPGYSPPMLSSAKAQRSISCLQPTFRYIYTIIQTARFDEHVASVLHSLRCIVHLRPSVMFCGHRGMVPDATKHLTAKLQARTAFHLCFACVHANTSILQWLLGLQQRARALVGGGASVEHVRRLLLGREDFLYYFSMGDFSRKTLLAGLLKGASDSA